MRVRVNAVIQARTGSTRLPGKVLRRLGDRTVLDWVVRAAMRAEGLDGVVVATSTQREDDPVAELAEASGVYVVRGSELDVLDRFLLAVDRHPCDAVVRLTADCPLLDPVLVAQVVGAWRAAPGTDYVATTLARTLPRGLDVELVRTSALREVGRSAVAHDRIHVTSAVYAQPARFSLLGVVVAPTAEDLRVTLDTAEDAEVIERVVAALGDQPPAWRDVVAFLRAHPEVVQVNSTVLQKRLEEG
jgi:spore coat polysaccharide biosynthesis protein SpsF